MSEVNTPVPEDTQEHLEQAEPSLQQKTMRGLGWSTASTFINAVLQVAYTSTVARLVVPEAFGVVAASGTILRFGGYFSEMGIGKAIIQKADLTETDVRAAFTGSLGLGLFFAILFSLLAPVLAPLLMDDPELVPILRFQALSFFTAGLNSTPFFLLRRRMDFASIAKIELSSFIICYGGVGVGLAYAGYGIWGIAAAGIAQQVVMALMGYAVVRHTLSPIFAKAAFTPLLGYGGRVSVISFIEFLSSNADVFVIGKRLGSTILGFYSRAQMLVQLPIYNLTQAMSRVLFPAMSSIQHDIPRLRRVYTSSITLLGFIILPIGIGLSVAGEEAIRTLLGQNFLPAVPILQILAIMTPFRLLTYFSGLVCDSTGHLNVKIRTELIFVVFYGLSFWFVGGIYGIEGICYAILFGEVLRFSVYIFILKSILQYAYGELLMGYIPALMAALCVGGSIAGMRYLLPDTILSLPLLALVLEGAAGAFGLAIGLGGPWSRPLRRQIFERFLGKTAFGQGRLGRLFVNL